MTILRTLTKTNLKSLYLENGLEWHDPEKYKQIIRFLPELHSLQSFTVRSISPILPIGHVELIKQTIRQCIRLGDVSVYCLENIETRNFMILGDDGHRTTTTRKAEMNKRRLFEFGRWNQCNKVTTTLALLSPIHVKRLWKQPYEWLPKDIMMKMFDYL